MKLLFLNVNSKISKQTTFKSDTLYTFTPVYHIILDFLSQGKKSNQSTWYPESNPPQKNPNSLQRKTHSSIEYRGGGGSHMHDDNSESLIFQYPEFSFLTDFLFHSLILSIIVLHMIIFCTKTAVIMN
jgi:hypothetical protein